MMNVVRRIKTALLALAAVAAALVMVPAAGEGDSLEPPLAASSNVHLLAHVPGTAAGMNFKDHYAYVSGWSGITVLDIAKAGRPAARRRAPAAALRERGRRPVRRPPDRRQRPRGEGHRLGHVRGQHREPHRAVHRRRAPARADRVRPRLRPHLQLRQAGLHAGVGRRRRPRRGRRPDRPERAEVARQVRVGRVDERRLQGQPRHRARQHRHGLERRRRRRGRLQADRQSARPAAAGHDRQRRQQPLALQRLHPPQLAAPREDAADHRGGLHRHRRGPAGRLPRPGQVRDVGRLPAGPAARSRRRTPGRPSSTACSRAARSTPRRR